MPVPTFLTGTLKWLASLGTAVLIPFAYWLLSLVGIREGHTALAAMVVVGALVAKLVGWLVATYGPRPTTPTNGKPAMRSTRKPRTNGQPNGPSRPDEFNPPPTRPAS